MSAMPRSRSALLRSCLLLAALAGCAQGQPTQYYTLSTVTEPAAAPRSGQGLVIGLGPLTLPQYLDRPDIVTRAGAHQMRLGEFSQWAEPLEPLLARTMAEDLHARLGADDVIPIPQRRDLPLDRAVEVDFARFDAKEAGEVKLDARWRVFRGAGDTLVASGRSQVAAVPDYDAIVAAMSRAVGRLSAEIAAGIAAEPPVLSPAAMRGNDMKPGRAAYHEDRVVSVRAGLALATLLSAVLGSPPARAEDTAPPTVRWEQHVPCWASLAGESS